MKTFRQFQEEDKKKRITYRSKTLVQPASKLHKDGVTYTVTSCSKALPSLHYNGYIVNAVEDIK